MLTGKTLLSLLALRMLSLIIITLWWLKAIFVRRDNAEAVELFVGFGAGSESSMFAQFANEGERTVAHLDQTKPGSLATVVVPGILLLWRNCWNEAGTVVNVLKNSSVAIIRQNFHDWLSSATLRFSTYVFVKSWTNTLPEQVRRIVFIEPGVSASAAIEANKLYNNMCIELWQHGLLKKSVLIPRFCKILAINLPEAQYLSRRSDNVTLRNAEIDSVCKTYDNNILFTSLYSSNDFDKENHTALLTGVFSWFKDNGYRVIVRPHPCEAPGFWQKYYPSIYLDTDSINLAVCIETWRPIFVTSWFSTSLLDALNACILPIMLIEGGELELEDTVFPLGEITMNWPRDMELINAVSADVNLYRDELFARRNAAFGQYDGGQKTNICFSIR